MKKTEYLIPTLRYVQTHVDKNFLASNPLSGDGLLDDLDDPKTYDWEW